MQWPKEHTLSYDNLHRRLNIWQHERTVVPRRKDIQVLNLFQYG
jgi:hypothetical protein